jgi:hypothetical protein
MLMAVAAEASVEIYPPGARMCPTNSGKVYVSDGNRVLTLTIRFWFPALSNCVTRLTEIVRADVS